MLSERTNCAQRGWGAWTRTKINGTRNRCPTIRRHPNFLIYVRLTIPKNEAFFKQDKGPACLDVEIPTDSEVA